MNDTQQLILAPDNIPVLSKENAATFHGMVKQRIYDTGVGLFEYIETIKFFAALDKVINGDSSSKIDPDKEFISYVREQIKLNSDKDTFTSTRRVKFTVAEVGTTYDFSKCGDPILADLEEKAAEAAESVKNRKEFLKAIPEEGVEIRQGDELVNVYRPSKASKSSFKVQLPK